MLRREKMMCALWSMEAAAVVKRWPTSGIPVKETKIAFWHVATISGRHCYPKQTIGSPCDDDSDCMSNNCGLLTCRSPEEEEENVQISPLTGPSPLPTIAPTAGNPSSTTPGGDRITEESIMCFTLRAEAGKGGGCVARNKLTPKMWMLCSFRFALPMTMPFSGVLMKSNASEARSMMTNVSRPPEILAVALLGQELVSLLGLVREGRPIPNCFKSWWLRMNCS